MTRKQRRTLAQRVVEARKKAVKTQQELAQAAGLSLSLVASIEQGKAGDPKLSTLRKIAKALGVTTADLLPDVDKE